MFERLESYAPASLNLNQLFQFALKWTPRAIVAGLAGYYSLGIAYESGLMAAIDRVAMRILLPSMGYVGVGAFMPTFQWYSAWGVRVTAAIGAGLLYDILAKIVWIAYTALPFSRRNQPLAIAPTIQPCSPTLFPTAHNRLLS